MLCPNCESENRDGAKFCDECGFPLSGVLARTVVAAKAPESEEPQSSHEAIADASPKESNDIAEDEGLTEVLPEGEPLRNDDERHGNASEEGPGESDGEGRQSESGPIQSAPTMAFDEMQTRAFKEDQPASEYGERVVGPDYTPPKADWRDGNTMQMPRVEGEEPPRSRDFLASSAKKQSRKNLKLIVGIPVAIIAVAAVALFATYQMQFWGGTVIPDVTGMTEADAESVLTSTGFTVRPTNVKSDDTEGLVLIMDPSAGSRAEKGSEVVIHIATARTVPEVIGKTEGEAKDALEDAGYENVAFEAEKSDSTEGTVLSINPDVGSRAKSSATITVKVAEPYVVPECSGLGLDESIAAIQGEGLPYDIAYIDTEEYPDGSVIGTEPEAGAKVKSTTVVTIDVARARGAQLVELTKGIIAPGETVAIGGNSYEVESLDTVEYIGNDVVSFTMTARPYTFILGEYVYISSRSVAGQISFTPDNQVAGIS